MILVEKKEGFLMGAVWIIFIPFIVIFYASSEKKIKERKVDELYLSD